MEVNKIDLETALFKREASEVIDLGMKLIESYAKKRCIDFWLYCDTHENTYNEAENRYYSVEELYENFEKQIF